MKKIAVMITNYNIIEVDAEAEAEAIEKVQSQLDLRVATASSFCIVRETIFDEEAKTYRIDIKGDKNDD